MLTSSMTAIIRSLIYLDLVKTHGQNICFLLRNWTLFEILVVLTVSKPVPLHAMEALGGRCISYSFLTSVLDGAE
jgi:hypothetical protein